MRPEAAWTDFFLKEWLLSASAFGLLVTSVYLRSLPTFSAADLEVLFLLWALFLSVRGLESSGLFDAWSRRIESGGFLSVKLVTATFFLSMVVTNDVALLAVVPVTLGLNGVRKDWLVILEALAANAGSALTPIGNPQNLFLYWFYGVHPLDFVLCIAPLSGLLLLLLVGLALAADKKQGRERVLQSAGVASSRAKVNRGQALVYAVGLAFVVAAVLRLVPVAVTWALVGYCVLFDRRTLRVDYGLLATFLLFFGLSSDVREIVGASLEHSGHIFVLSAVSSQVMSNVPAALLFSRFTRQWPALLWGVSVGGFGSLVSSLANLIAYRFYVNQSGGRAALPFFLRFTLLGYAFFVVGVCLYWLRMGVL